MSRRPRTRRWIDLEIQRAMAEQSARNHSQARATLMEFIEEKGLANELVRWLARRHGVDPDALGLPAEASAPKECVHE